MEKGKRAFLTQSVLPVVSPAIVDNILAKYPRVRFGHEDGTLSLVELPVTMLVAFTGTGKTTTLKALQRLPDFHYADDIPTRREIADLFVIPAAQVLLGEAVVPPTDRGERFRLTRYFGEEFARGGYVLAYGCLFYAWDGTAPLLSDGIRGPREIRYVLEQIPQWQVIELWVDPLVRLKRLSQRRDEFDQVKGTQDLSFLEEPLRADVHEALRDGLITAQALEIVQAESRNYGMQPFDRTNGTPRYHFLAIGELSPLEVAYKIKEIVSR